MSDTIQPDIFRLEGKPPLDFDCDRDEQNEFLQGRAFEDQARMLSVTYLAHTSGITVGFMTLAMDAIALQSKEKPDSSIPYKRFSAIKIAQLATDRRWKGRGIGKSMVAFGAHIALRLQKDVGCRYLTVDAKPDVVDWYRSQEFNINKIAKKDRLALAQVRNVDPDSLPISMRQDLAWVLADLQDRFPHDFPTAG
jgi:GNAT superfamily N-acetyltransferase